MDPLAVPPEVTSALIHTGPGAWSLMEASDAWRALAIGLEESACGYASAVSALTESWGGTSSTAMVQAVEPYLDWLRGTGQQCLQAASSAQAAAAAFNAARSAVVEPADVLANRTRLAQLLATNWFGTNLAAIAATEDQYGAMWANNSAAMYRYQAASAQAATLPPFSSPPAIATSAGLGSETRVVPARTAPAGVARAAAATPAAAAATPAAAAVPATATSAQSAIGDLLGSLSTPFGFDPNSGWFGLANAYANQFVAGGFPINLLSFVAQITAAQSLQSVSGEVGTGLSEGEAALGEGASGLGGALGAGLGEAEPAAAIRVAVSVGKLMAPPSVVGLLPAAPVPVQLTSAVSPLPVDDMGFPSIPMPPMRMPSAASKSSRKREGRDYDEIEYGLELKGTVMHRPPSAG